MFWTVTCVFFRTIQESVSQHKICIAKIYGCLPFYFHLNPWEWGTLWNTSCYSLTLWAPAPLEPSAIPRGIWRHSKGFPSAAKRSSQPLVWDQDVEGRKIGGLWKSGIWKANKGVFWFCASVLWNASHLHQRQKSSEIYYRIAHQHQPLLTETHHNPWRLLD